MKTPTTLRRQDIKVRKVLPTRLVAMRVRPVRAPYDRAKLKRADLMSD